MDVADLRAQLDRALAEGSEEAIEDAVDQVLDAEGSAVVPLLNDLLVTPGHFAHQAVAKRLQDFAAPSTVAYVQRALDMGLDHLEYTASEPEVIGKWYSHLLASIGTSEAIELIRMYAASGEEGIAAAMKYRLAKLERGA